MGKVAQRRARVSEAILATALEVMAEGGAASLSLGEVARRLGMRTPSLYGYFDSRAALCDEVFRRGWQSYGELTAGLRVSTSDDLTTVLHGALVRAVNWANEHRASAELMFWRPIPNWTPSPAAFETAIAVFADAHDFLRHAQSIGLLRADADPVEMTEALGVLFTGLISQQLSNEPGIAAESGRVSRHAHALAAMFANHYAPDSPPATGGTP